MIYFVQAVDGGPIKIGYSDCVRDRAMRIGWDIKKRTRVLGVIDGDGGTERYLHERFSKFRTQIGYCTEWFFPDASILAYIEQRCHDLPEKPKGAPAGRPKSARGARSAAFAFKAYPEWKEWLEGFRDHRGDMTVANVIDAALKFFARAEKYRDPPKR